MRRILRHEMCYVMNGNMAIDFKPEIRALTGKFLTPKETDAFTKQDGEYLDMFITRTFQENCVKIFEQLNKEKSNKMIEEIESLFGKCA